MSSSQVQPPGQMRTEVPDPDGGRPKIVISSGREVELGARSMLVLAERLFRFDVIPHADSVQTILRNLSKEPAAEMRYSPVGGGATILTGPRELATSATTRFGGEVVLIGEDEVERAVARILVGSVCHLERGVTSFTAQAALS
jgi:hypothetical protein